MSLFCAIISARLSLTNRNPGAWGVMAVGGAIFDIFLALVIFGDPACQ